ncbi:MAG: cell division protein SepF [Oscillospiraceae bacterium]|nr:cell division protein SepF [Oscillospiraceae bacterium]
MSFFDELKKLTRPYDEDEEDEFAEERDTPATRVQQKPRRNPFAAYTPENPPAPAPAAPQQRHVRQKEGRLVSLGSGNSQSQVVLITPDRFETAAEVADHLRSSRAVLLNMESTPKDVARRLVDFLSGVTYAIDGNIRKIASNTYILTPQNVNLVGDQLDELENSGIYF